MANGAELDFSPCVSKDCRDLIANLLTYDPNKRPNIDFIISHPWMEEYSKLFGINLAAIRKKYNENNLCYFSTEENIRKRSFVNSNEYSDDLSTQNGSAGDYQKTRCSRKQSGLSHYKSSGNLPSPETKRKISDESWFLKGFRKSPDLECKKRRTSDFEEIYEFDDMKSRKSSTGRICKSRVCTYYRYRDVDSEYENRATKTLGRHKKDTVYMTQLKSISVPFF